MILNIFHIVETLNSMIIFFTISSSFNKPAHFRPLRSLEKSPGEVTADTDAILIFTGACHVNYASS